MKLKSFLAALILLVAVKGQAQDISVRLQETFAKEYSGKKVECKAIDVKNGIYELDIDNKKVAQIFHREVKPKIETFCYVVALKPDYTILKLQVLNFDTKYGQPLKEAKWTNQFIGKNPKSKKLDREVDAISGATLSVKAILDDLKKLPR